MIEDGELQARQLEAGAQLASVLWNSDEAIIAIDLDGVVIGWNRGAEQLYGFTVDESLGQQISLICPINEVEALVQILKRIPGGEATRILEGTRLRKDGSTVGVEYRISPIFNAAGEDRETVVGALSVERDVSERRQREREVLENNAFLQRSHKIGRIGSWKSKIGPESVLTFTPETYRILGIAPGVPIRNIDLFNLVHPDDQQLLVETLIKLRNDRSRAESEIRITRSDGAQRWLSVAAEAQLSDDGEVVGTIGVVQDITDHKEAELRLENDALHDQLTGLASRGLFLDRARRAMERATWSGSNATVFYLNLDGFNLFKDARGNEQGDALLCAVADRLRSATHAGDTAARFVDDEFALVCEHLATASDVVDRAARIRDAIKEPFLLEGNEAFSTASIGVAVGGSALSAEELVRDAALAMHRAKEQGRDRFELYDLRLRDQIERRVTLEGELRAAIDRQELFLEYQPIKSLSENRFVGAEALLRWRHPERGVIPPGEFVPIAEEVGLIMPIGKWVLESACSQLRQWREASPEHGNWRVSVNVAASQLAAPEFLDTVSIALERAGIDGTALSIELTESAIMDSGIVNDVLQRIRDLGVRVSIDDFGTKYSSLGYITRLPIDELKIDQSFTAAVADDPSTRAVVSAMLAIGRSLDLVVTAEGVETEAQLNELITLGCEFVQGRYFADAMPSGDCLIALRRTGGPASDG